MRSRCSLEKTTRREAVVRIYGRWTTSLRESLQELPPPVGIHIAGRSPVELNDIECIARGLVRDYELPLRVESVSAEQSGRCTVGFCDRYSAATVLVLWCDEKVSPHSMRESLKQRLHTGD